MSSTDAVHRRLGYTLLELILALVLMSTLLAAAWSLLGVFQNRLEQSQRQAEQWQLIRSLQQTLQADLNACFLPATLGEASDRGLQQAAPDLQITSNEVEDRDNDPDSERLATVAEDDEPLATDDAISVALNDASAATGVSRLDPITGELWLVPDTLLFGTSTGLIVDVVPPAKPGSGVPPQGPPSLEQAAVPEVQQRVIYTFADARSAMVSDRPRGLVRCRLSAREHLILRQLGSGQQDLIGLLRPWLADPDSPNSPPGETGPGGSEEVTRTNVGASADAASAPLPLAANEPLESDLPSGPGPSMSLEQSVDYVPEVASFSLRYFDGTAWRSNWDSRAEGRLPVAVELRFQLQSELPAATPDGVTPAIDAPSGADSTAEANRQWLQTESELDEVDSELRSALTEPPEDHRYLIVLRGATEPSVEAREVLESW